MNDPIDGYVSSAFQSANAAESTKGGYPFGYSDWSNKDQLAAIEEGWCMQRTVWNGLYIREYPVRDNPEGDAALAEALHNIRWLAEARSPLHWKAWCLHVRTRGTAIERDMIRFGRVFSDYTSIAPGTASAGQEPTKEETSP